MAEQNLYRDRVVVITGASSGFGRGTALELASRGAHLVLAARSEETLRDLALECEALGGRAIAVPTDVSNAAAVENLARAAKTKFGSFQAWINDAGVAAIGRFDRVPLEDHLKVIETDLMGTLVGSYCAIKHFRERGEGILVNVASMLGKIPAPLYASYIAAKFGVVGLSDSLRQELNEENISTIRVCTVMPMAHDTEFFEHASNYTGHQGVPIPPTYDPSVTVEALVRLVVEPDDEVITGWQGGVFNALHRLIPNSIEKVMGKNTTQAQLKKAPEAFDKRGSVHQPSKA